MGSAALPLALALLAALCAAAGAQRDCYGAVVEVKVLRAGSSGPVEAVYGYPAPFGALLNNTATAAAPLVVANPLTACDAVVAAPVPGAAALVERGNCSFAAKAWALQRAGYGSMLLANNEEDCVFMSANRTEAQGLTLAVVSLTKEAGALLQRLAAAAAAAAGDQDDAAAEGGEGGQLEVTLRLPVEGPIDWSSVALWIIATGTVVAGSLWAGQGHLAAFGGRESGTPTAKKGAAEAVPSVTISSQAAVGFVVFASAMLVVLFFFLSKWLAYILVSMFALGAWQASGMVIFSALQNASSPQWRASYLRLPLAGLVPVNGMIALVAGGALCITWAIWHNAVWSWPLQDIMGICFMLVILKQFFLPNLKVASVLLCLAFVYDVWWVFLQPMVTGGESVMIEVATGGASHEQLPMVLRWPHNALGTNPAFALLGLGDVVLPGLLAVFCRRFDLANRLSLARSYFLPCAVGYGGGLLTTYAALYFSWFGDEGQPALLYLVPGTLGTITLLALSRGQFAALWNNDFEAGSGARLGGGGASSSDLAAREAAERMEAGGMERLLPNSDRESPLSQL